MIMAAIEEDFLADAEEDARIVSYIQSALPAELKDKFTEEDIYYFLDIIIEYYSDSGILEQEPDDDGFVEIDLEDVAAHIARKARKEGIGDFTPEELLFVVQAHMDYEEESEN